MWPDSCKCAIAMSFDLDAETLWMEEYPKLSPSYLSRGEYGIRVGLPRILELLNKYDITSTFFVPGYVIEKYSDAVEKIIQAGHEIGHHGYQHEPPSELEPGEESKILDKGISIIKAISGKAPAGYRSPSLDLSPVTVDLLIQKGFKYESSLMADEKPYYLYGSGQQGRLVEIPVDWSLDDAPYYLFNYDQPYWVGLTSPKKTLEIWKAEFDGYYKSGGCFSLIAHPQISGRHHRLQTLDSLLGYITKHSDVWYANLEAVADYWLDNFSS